MHIYGTVLALTALTAGVRALPPRRIAPRNGISNIYTGSGGSAPGGSITAANTNCTGTDLPILGCVGSIVQLDSDNAGNGGVGSSGPVDIQRVASKKFGASTSKFKGAHIGNVTTGMGGSAPGGSVAGVTGGLIQLGSNNAGNGGTGTSGGVF
ncbi:hypothetical protein DFH29DRAFT_486525 [Suillus ampliporus]|nr:hypothetical protein DFH29DRAFT_486525 [Suillus ampliporus]